MRSSFQGLPRPFWALWTATLVNRLGGVVEPFFALYLASRGVGLATIGVLTAVVGAGSLLAHPIGGVLADRVGRRETFAIGMGGAAVSFVVLGAADALWLIAVAGFSAGLFVDMYRPAGGALVADLVAPADRPRAFALLFWVVNIGFATAAALAGRLAEEGYGLLFAIDAVTCVLCAAIVWRFVPGGRGPAGAVGAVAGRLRDVAADRTMVLFCLTATLGSCVYVQAFTTLPLAMGLDGLGPGTYGAVIALNGVLIIVVQPLVLPLLRKVPRTTLLVVGQAGIGVGFALNGLAPTVLAYALPLVVWTSAEVLWNSAAPSIVSDLAPEHLRGRYQGAFGLAFGASLVLGPLGGAALLDAAGDRALWTACGVAGLAAAGGFAALAPALGARSPE